MLQLDSEDPSAQVDVWASPRCGVEGEQKGMAFSIAGVTRPSHGQTPVAVLEMPALTLLPTLIRSSHNGSSLIGHALAAALVSSSSG